MTGLPRHFAASCLVLTALFWPQPAGAQEQPGKINRVEFRFQTVDGRTLRLEDLRGKVVLLDFWATWCAPCLAEMPRLKRLHAAYSPEDFVIIGISLDAIDRRAFTSWVRRNSLPWTHVLDGRGYNGELARRFKVEELPDTLLLDRDGHPAARDLRGPALETAIRNLVLGNHIP